VPLLLKWLLRSFKHVNHHILNAFRQKWSKVETEQYCLLCILSSAKIKFTENKLLGTIHENINHFLNTSTKCTLYICYIYFLSALSSMFRCVIHRPQGKIRIHAQNSQLFTRLFCLSCWAIPLLWLEHFIRGIFIVVN
jgi:hypothetical protein